MFDALADEPFTPAKPAKAVAAAPAKAPVTKGPVGGQKKSDAPKRDTQASSSQATSSGQLLGEVRKDASKGPRHKHAPRTTQEGKIRGREFDRHSGTGRPANENKRQGGGSRNWGNVKDAQADHEAVSSVPVEQLEGVPVVEGAAAPVEGAEVAAEIKVEAEPEVKTQSLASFRAEQAKKQKDLESALGLGPRSEARQVKPDWYKPENKAAAPAASKATTSAAKEQKQAKKFVPVSSIVGEVYAPRGDREDRRGPRRDRSEGGQGERREQRSEGGDRRGPRRDGSQGGRNNQGGRKQGKTFDATADANSLPTLGQ